MSNGGDAVMEDRREGRVTSDEERRARQARWDAAEQRDVQRWQAGLPVAGYRDGELAAIAARIERERLRTTTPLGRFVAGLARRYGLAVPPALARSVNDGWVTTYDMRYWLQAKLAGEVLERAIEQSQVLSDLADLRA